MELLQKIADKRARIGIIGLGYVGLPLAVEFARAGFHVVGYDVDASKTSTLNGGVSYIPDVPTEHVAEIVKAGTFRAGVDPVQLYISIAGLSYFYLGNSHTLSTIFDRPLLGTKAKVERLSHMTDLVLGYLVRD